MDLPIRIDIDEYCRADSKLLMSCEDEVLYIGFSPDGDDPGRRCAARISAVEDRTPVPYTCGIREGKVFLQTEKGYAEFSVGNGEELIVSGRNIGLMISNGKATNSFMGGGNAVKDARGGALFAIAGVRMRFLPRKGTVLPDSFWNFNYLCDPDPKLYLLPDGEGFLETVMFASDRDEDVADDGISADDAAKKLAEDFRRYCGQLGVDMTRTTAARAAWALWNCRQPAREAWDLGLRISPAIIRGRRSSGSLFAEDYALSALAENDPDTALKMMVQPFAAIQQDGFLPSKLANHKLQFLAARPLYGVVLASRKDIADRVGDKEYELLKRALTWWTDRRYCERHGLFYYEHRTENAGPEPLPFLGLAPVMTPDLNACMLLWLGQMTALAEKLGRSGDAGMWTGLEAHVRDGIPKYLGQGGGYRCLSVTGDGSEGTVGGGFLAEAVLSGGVMPEPAAMWSAPGYAAEFLALYGGTKYASELADAVLAGAEGRPIPDLRSAVTCLLADRIRAERR